MRIHFFQEQPLNNVYAPGTAMGSQWEPHPHALVRRPIVLPVLRWSIHDVNQQTAEPGSLIAHLKQKFPLKFEREPMMRTIKVITTFPIRGTYIIAVGELYLDSQLTHDWKWLAT